MIVKPIFIVGLAALIAGPAQGQAKARQSPLVESLARCLAETDDAARLRCYDAAAKGIVKDAANGNLVLLDQRDLRKARRSLFGFGVPKLPFFDGDRSASEQEDEITATIASARGIGYRKWHIKLEDGAAWETTEASSSQNEPRAGNTVVIKRGPLGSYMMRIAGQRGLRAKRVG